MTKEKQLEEIRQLVASKGLFITSPENMSMPEVRQLLTDHMNEFVDLIQAYVATKGGK